MPVSKKRKKKQSSAPPPVKNRAVATPKKKKLSKQQIIIYVISGLMILSLAIGLIATGSTRSARSQPTPVPQATNLILETPSPDNDQSNQSQGDPTGDSAAPTTTAE